MDELPRERLVEWGIDGAAAATFAGALTFAWLELAGGGLGAAAAGLAGFAITFTSLRRVLPEATSFTLADLEPAPVQLAIAAQDELLLGPEMALQQEAVADELFLDDVLASIGPQSRVVRLFDPARLPTAGELRASIERHLRQERTPAVPSDATDVLHEALAELRRSLR